MEPMTPGTVLPPAAELVRDGVTRLRERFWLLLGVLSAGTVAAAGAFAVPLVGMTVWQLTGSPPWRAWAAALALALGAGLLLGSWSQAAVFDAAMSEEPGIDRSLRRAWSRILPFSWTCVVAMALVAGGLLLFVIPGLYLAVPLSLAPLVSLEEDVSGVEACARALAYARGHWAGLAGRLLLIGAIGMLPSLVPIVGWLLGGLISPLPLVCLAFLYRAVRQAPAAAASRWPLALGVAGWIPGLWLSYAAVSQARALWPRMELQARLAARNLDAAKAQQVLTQLQSGQAGPGTALEMVSLLQGAASGVSISSRPAPGAPPR